MTEELKSAIRTIAEYDGWSLQGNVWRNNSSNIGYLDYNTETFTIYHTSADALLPVLRKARLDRWGSDMNGTWDIGLNYILMAISNNNLPEACLKLAEIINQLKEQK